MREKILTKNQTFSVLGLKTVSVCMFASLTSSGIKKKNDTEASQSERTKKISVEMQLFELLGGMEHT